MSEGPIEVPWRWVIVSRLPVPFSPGSGAGGERRIAVMLRLCLYAFIPVVFGWTDVPCASEKKPPAVPFKGPVSTDWYAVFLTWDETFGDKYLDGRDGGSFAWGPSAYVQRMYLNLYRTFEEPVWLDKLVRQIDRILNARSDVPQHEVHDARYVDGYGGWGQNRYRQYSPEYTDLIRTSAPADNDCEISKLSYICIFISYFGNIYCDFG